MASVSFFYKPKGLAIGREQIQAILGGGIRREASASPTWNADYAEAQMIEPHFSGGSRDKMMLSWEDDYNRGYKRDKNARGASREASSN